MNLRNRRFETLKEARKFHKGKKEQFGWHIRKIPNAKKLKYFVGTDLEWLNLD